MNKKLVNFVFFFLAVLFYPAAAQNNEGVIRYELRIDMHRNIPADREDMKAMIPQYRTDNYVLYFNQEERLYKMQEETEVVSSGRGGGRQFRFSMPRSETYMSTLTSERTVFQELMGKNYLIIDTLALAPWRLGNEYMDILGYRCQMAWYVDTVLKEEVTAWFTVGLQPFMGPDRFATIPGTILALDINNGERVWVARKVEFIKLKSDDIRKPARGERITRAEYNAMMEQQRERMRTGGPGFRF